jgi:hypothetical protein
MVGARLPVPETLALYGTQRLGFGHVAPGRIGDFLRAAPDWPIFAKPVGGTYSLGAMRLTGIEGDLVKIDGIGPVPLAELERYMTELSDFGYLLQRCLRPSAFTAEHLLGGLSSVRVMTLLNGPEITVESAVLKVAGQGATADNFWRQGNALAAVDIGTGRLTRVIIGGSPNAVETHPRTGRPLAGLMLPGWPAVVELARAASSAFPRIRTQAWDIALTDNGPVLIEVNSRGDLNLLQLAHRRGALTESYCEHLRRCGWKKSLPE